MPTITAPINHPVEVGDRVHVIEMIDHTPDGSHDPQIYFLTRRAADGSQRPTIRSLAHRRERLPGGYETEYIHHGVATVVAIGVNDDPMCIAAQPEHPGRFDPSVFDRRLTTAQAAELAGLTEQQVRNLASDARRRYGVELQLPREQWPDARTPLYDADKLRTYLAER